MFKHIFKSLILLCLICSTTFSFVATYWMFFDVKYPPIVFISSTIQQKENYIVVHYNFEMKNDCAFNIQRSIITPKNEIIPILEAYPNYSYDKGTYGINVLIKLPDFLEENNKYYYQPQFYLKCNPLKTVHIAGPKLEFIYGKPIN